MKRLILIALMVAGCGEEPPHLDEKKQITSWEGSHFENSTPPHWTEGMATEPQSDHYVDIRTPESGVWYYMDMIECSPEWPDDPHPETFVIPGYPIDVKDGPFEPCPNFGGIPPYLERAES